MIEFVLEFTSPWRVFIVGSCYMEPLDLLNCVADHLHQWIVHPTFANINGLLCWTNGNGLRYSLVPTILTYVSELGRETDLRRTVVGDTAQHLLSLLQSTVSEMAVLLFDHYFPMFFLIPGFEVRFMFQCSPVGGQPGSRIEWHSYVVKMRLIGAYVWLFTWDPQRCTQADPTIWKAGAESIPNLVRCLSAALDGLVLNDRQHYPTLKGVRKCGQMEYGPGRLGGHDCVQQCLNYCML